MVSQLFGMAICSSIWWSHHTYRITYECLIPWLHFAFHGFLSISIFCVCFILWSWETIWICLSQGQGACNHFQWLDSPAKQSDEEVFEGQNKIATPEKPVTLEMNDGTGHGHLGQNTSLSFSFANEPRGPKLDDRRAATTDDEPEPMLIDVSRVLETPLLSPKRVRKSSNVGLSSPLKRLDLRDRSPGASTPEKCYRCGKEGHRMKECTWSFRPTCFKCGRCGHWTDDCTAWAWRMILVCCQFFSCLLSLYVVRIKQLVRKVLPTDLLVYIYLLITHLHKM